QEETRPVTQAFGSAAGVQDSYKRQAHPREEPRSSPPPNRPCEEEARWDILGFSPSRKQLCHHSLFRLGPLPFTNPRDQSVKLCKHRCPSRRGGLLPPVSLPARSFPEQDPPVTESGLTATGGKQAQGTTRCR
ncbi:unnamed protein product, partial [Gulo gulo]